MGKTSPFIYYQQIKEMYNHQSPNLLILPSRRLLMHAAGKLLSVGLECEQYSVCEKVIAMHHYKTLTIYPYQQLLAKQVLLSEGFLKKLELVDVYVTAGRLECVIADKFGDMYRVEVPEQPKSVTPVYINSNLGIPKFFKHIGREQEEFLVLADDQNRIKVYNSLNPHELVSIWHLVNTYAMECHVVADHLVLLLKSQNPQSLREDIHLHRLPLELLKEEEYPGKPIPFTLEFNAKTCKYYTMTVVEGGLILLLLQENCIQWELINLSSENPTLQKGQIPISSGNWDYLDAIKVGRKLLMVYGADVEVNLPIEQQQWGDEQQIQFNKYEHFISMQLPF